MMALRSVPDRVKISSKCNSATGRGPVAIAPGTDDFILPPKLDGTKTGRDKAPCIV